MKRTLLVALVSLATTSPSFAQNTGKARAERPDHTFLRFNEDWSVMSDRSRVGDEAYWDGIKFVPLNDRRDVWMSFGGHFQGRLEVWRSFMFGEGSGADDTWFPYRVTFHADLHVGDGFRAFIEVKSAYSTDRKLPGGNRSVDRDLFALENAFVDFNTDVGEDGTLTVRVGRRQFQLGKQRLVSPLPWANALRRWDGVSGIYQDRGWTTRAFWSLFAPTDSDGFNEPDPDLPFWGVYASGNPGPFAVMDVYYLGYGNRTSPTWNGTTGDETRQTLGVRVNGTFRPGFDYDAETAYQFGSVGDGSVSAYMIGSEIGYRLTEVPWRPRLLVGFDLGSGDDRPGGDVEVFNQLYPLGHAYLGLADVVGRQNVVAASVGVETQPVRGATVGARGFWFSRHSTADAVYGVGGRVFRPGGGTDAKSIASEIDIWWRQKIDRYTSTLVGYSRVFAGDFIKDSGPAENTDFFYIELQYRF